MIRLPVVRVYVWFDFPLRLPRVSRGVYTLRTFHACRSPRSRFSYRSLPRLFTTHYHVHTVVGLRTFTSYRALRRLLRTTYAFYHTRLRFALLPLLPLPFTLRLIQFVHCTVTAVSRSLPDYRGSTRSTFVLRLPRYVCCLICHTFTFGWFVHVHPVLLVLAAFGLFYTFCCWFCTTFVAFVAVDSTFPV